ncbi:MAG TPA: MiaB/RimO family radical SAM methylthiotransferase, partial [Clostridia bacterium]|nr:MiaB/RimO family radical SAM methylthiotransferase [Clostridia bacterium]
KVLEEARRLVKNGYQEIVLTGICTGAYGRDLGEGMDLNRLLLQLKDIPGLRRLRISSLDPNDFTPELIDTLTGDPVFCSHLHISLQSGHDKILRDMRRQYTTAYFADLLQALRQRRPRIAITTDIMVGFPGETEEEHRSSLAFVERMALAGLHVFKYSPRKGTKAYDFPGQVPHPVKEKRSQDFLALDKKLRDAYARSFLGETLAVLVETDVEGGYWEGHTDNYLKVRFPAAEDLRGQIVPVRLLETAGDYILGSLV